MRYKRLERGMRAGSTCCMHIEYTLSLKKIDTDVAHYNFNAHQPILLNFGRDVPEITLSNGDLLSHLS